MWRATNDRRWLGAVNTFVSTSTTSASSEAASRGGVYLLGTSRSNQIDLQRRESARCN